jgi:pimeloyl-ACP methyl ester carboxylesterase
VIGRCGSGEAEDAFNVAADLPRITAPTLVIGGTNDIAYPEELFRETAAGVQDGRAHLCRGWRHMPASASSATTHLTCVHGRSSEGNIRSNFASRQAVR